MARMRLRVGISLRYGQGPPVNRKKLNDKQCNTRSTCTKLAYSRRNRHGARPAKDGRCRMGWMWSWIVSVGRTTLTAYMGCDSMRRTTVAHDHVLYISIRAKVFSNLCKQKATESSNNKPQIHFPTSCSSIYLVFVSL